MNDDELISVFRQRNRSVSFAAHSLEGAIPNELMESGVEIRELQLDL